MRLLKKINYKRFLELKEKSIFKEIFNSVNGDDVKIKSLNFCFVIEYENAFDAINYEDMFPENSIFVDFQSLKKEHSNVISRIKKQIDSKKIPDFLKKLGVTNILKGCYLIGYSGNELPNNIKKSSKKITVVKLDYKNLPKEILDMCNDYFNKNIGYITKEKEEFDVFFKLTDKEQEKEMALLFQQFSNYTNKNMLFSISNTGLTSYVIPLEHSIPSLTLEELFEINIPLFTDIPFLEQVFEKAKEDENYELCGKIKQRIDFLKNHNKV